MKKEVYFALLPVFLLFLTSFVSAEMFISQPKGSYNMGDEFLFNVTIVPSSDMNDFFVAKIICAKVESSAAIEIYRIPLSLKV